MGFILEYLHMSAPNGVRYRRLEREKLENGKMPKLRNTSQKRAESQPSGARIVIRMN